MVKALGADGVFEALLDVYGPRLEKGSRLVDLRRSGDEAVLIFRWPPYADLFGVPLPLTNIAQRMDWNQPAEDLDEWLESVELWLLEDVENGMEWHAARRRVEDYIELRMPGWPDDSRFFVDIVGPHDQHSWLRDEFVARDGLNPRDALQRREEGTLIGWVTAYENNSTGSPYVAQATIVRDGATSACIDTLEAVSGVPATLVLDVVRSAALFAVGRGRTSVWTDLDVPHLDIAGFRLDPDSGRMVADGSFLGQDVVAARALFEADSGGSTRWGQDRDRSGRYLPASRLGRLFHRLRHGRTGAPPRIYVG